MRPKPKYLPFSVFRFRVFAGILGQTVSTDQEVRRFDDRAGLTKLKRRLGRVPFLDEEWVLL